MKFCDFFFPSNGSLILYYRVNNMFFSYVNILSCLRLIEVNVFTRMTTVKKGGAGGRNAFNSLKFIKIYITIILE